jgi:putative membrane protein
MNTIRLICRVWLLLVPVLVFSREALAQYRDYPGWGMGPGMMGWGMGGWYGPLFMVLFWVSIIVLIAFLIRWILSSDRSGRLVKTKEDSALDILKRRYARGEIDKQEYEAKKKDLS